MTDQDINKDYLELISKRKPRPQMLKLIVIYKKKSGEIVRALFSSKLDEMQRVDRRTLDLIEVEADSIPRDLSNFVVSNGILKQKSTKILNIERKSQLEKYLVTLNMQLETATANKLEEACKSLKTQIATLKKRIQDLGV